MVTLKTWVSPDGERGHFRPLVIKGMLHNLQGQDVLGQMDAVLTTAHRAFCEDILEEERHNRLADDFQKISPKDFFNLHNYHKEPRQPIKVYHQS